MAWQMASHRLQREHSTPQNPAPHFHCSSFRQYLAGFFCLIFKLKKPKKGKKSPTTLLLNNWLTESCRFFSESTEKQGPSIASLCSFILQLPAQDSISWPVRICCPLPVWDAAAQQCHGDASPWIWGINPENQQSSTSSGTVSEQLGKGLGRIYWSVRDQDGVQAGLFWPHVPICPPSCPGCNAEPFYHLTQEYPDTSLHLPHHPGRRSPSTPNKSYKNQEDFQLSCTKMPSAVRLHWELECFEVDSVDEWGRESTRSLLTQLRAARLYLPFVQGGQWGLSTSRSWLWAVTPAAPTGACVTGDPLQQFPCDCFYQLLKIRSALE